MWGIEWASRVLGFILRLIFFWDLLLSENSEGNSKTQGSRMKEMAKGKGQGVASQPAFNFMLSKKDEES